MRSSSYCFSYQRAQSADLINSFTNCTNWCRNVSDDSTSCFRVAHVSQLWSRWCTGAAHGPIRHASRCQLSSAISRANLYGRQCRQASFHTRGRSSTAMKRATCLRASFSPWQVVEAIELWVCMTPHRSAYQNYSQITMHINPAWVQSQIALGSAGSGTTRGSCVTRPKLRNAHRCTSHKTQLA